MSDALMHGLWLEDQQLSLRTDLPRPEPASGEALIRVRLAGICSTDLELTRGYYPYTGVPGHEFVGEVADAPEDRSWEGRRVVGEINAACGACNSCRSGRPTHCEERTVLGIVGRDGAFAQYLTLPLPNLHRVPDSVTDEAAVFCEPLAAALEICQQVHVRPTASALVVGAGRLGQLVARVLALTGCRLEVMARYEEQQQMLASRGIPFLHEGQLPRRCVDLVVETTGSVQGFSLARKAVRPRGTIVLKSTYAGQANQVDLSALVVDEITLQGSRCGPFAPALRLLSQGQVDTTDLYRYCFPLSRALRAFEMARRPAAMKVLLEL